MLVIISNLMADIFVMWMLELCTSRAPSVGLSCHELECVLFFYWIVEVDAYIHIFKWMTH